MTASKQKGTGGEREVRLLWEELTGIRPDRTAPTMHYDLKVEGFGPPIDVLATRPDRGEWLVTMRLEDAAKLWHHDQHPVHIEVKRYKRFSLHTIFESKFGDSQL